MASTHVRSCKIVDVQAPGKTPPSASGRAIIITNRPMIRQDPMMAAAPAPDMAARRLSRIAPAVSPASAGAPALPDAAAGDVQRRQDAPPVPDLSAAAALPLANSRPHLGASVPAVKPERSSSSESVAATPAAPQPSESFAQTASTAAHTSVPTALSPVEPVTPPAPATMSTDSQLAPNQALDIARKKADDAQAAREAEQEKIIASKQYYLPVRALAKRRVNRRALALLVLVVIVAAVWLDLVLDAGIIRLGVIHPLTHFFGSRALAGCRALYCQ